MKLRQGIDVPEVGPLTSYRNKFIFIEAGMNIPPLASNPRWLALKHVITPSCPLRLPLKSKSFWVVSEDSHSESCEIGFRALKTMETFSIYFPGAGVLCL